MTWPFYSVECRKEVDQLLKAGGSLSAYRASDAFPKWIGPKEGSHAWKLEMEIEAKFKVKHAVAVNSGTAALHSALDAINVRGREVVTTPYSFSATTSAILLAGGVPVYADIDPYTYCISKETVKRAITKKTAAILPVHLFGYMADLSSMQSFGIPVIEDACQAAGAVRDGACAGTVGIAGCISFNGSKNIPAGESGALITNSDKIAEKARLLINHAENFNSREVGYNYRIHEVVACIARHGLKNLDARNKRRIKLAKIVDYEAVMFDDDAKTLLSSPPYEWQGESVFYCFPATIHGYGIGRPLFIKRMAKRGIPVQAGYTTPLHHLPAFRKYAKKPLPVVDETHKKLCLLTTLTPDRPLSYAVKVAKAILESLG